MGGVDFGAMPRDALKNLVTNLGNSPIDNAKQTVAFLVDGAKRNAEYMTAEALEAGGWNLTSDEEDLMRETLQDDGLAGWEIELIMAGKPLQIRGL